MTQPTVSNTEGTHKTNLVVSVDAPDLLALLEVCTDLSPFLSFGY